ncbi:sigma-54 dependent transcriptional regulator [Sulfitobacter sp. S190]|uniref:sigma-54-dependent transcriptional regulator n=1 Tax=Sulfitobacter sp. S190 TaxID=2867022 RepID=UPI0021A70DD4|nr:sigma-54 dependent transcriptional regulator [Sulfitobacter sp. S190]UWR24412.1 sigma-54 dependent transcriptional regulator [Sulfitobacter sp. S190]
MNTLPLEDSEAYGPILARAAILVIDDEPGMRHFLSRILEPRVRRLAQAASAEEASAHLDTGHFDLIILDNIMPQKTGLDWIADQRRLGLYADTILITAYADLETAIAALRAGVSDFVLKPFRANQILNAVARTLDRSNLQRDNRLLRHALSGEGTQHKMIGTSPVMAKVRDTLAKLAPLQTPALFTGASGTGKEVAARALHALSDRADRPFVAVNCATLAPDQFVAQLFGVQSDGAARTPGLLELAEGGTLFLDEVAQLPDNVQAALLRVLEDGRIRPLGCEREIPLDLRFFFATNQKLDARVAQGEFRADLYHRMNVVLVPMPPLADRADDLVELAAHFMQMFAQDLSLPPLPLDEETLLKLRRHDWPGNVRELRNTIERSVIMGAFPPEFAGAGDVVGDRAIETLDLVTQRHIVHVLDQCGGNRAEAARRLGVSRKTIDRKCADWGM